MPKKSKPRFSDKLWPVHLKPKPDELLSSWVVRLAMAHGQKLHTFCALAWSGKAIWNRDVDKSAGAEIVDTLSIRTATPIERVRATTLATYAGILYEKHNHFGPNPWIMPVGIYHRKREKFGLQYCPRCLAEDDEPYFRRTWRLAFVVICEKHHTQLNDRCPQCGAAINFHRDELGNFNKFTTVSMTICYICGYDLKTGTGTSASPVKSAEIDFTKNLLKVMKDGFIDLIKSVSTYSHLFFTVLRQLMKILGMSDKRIASLRNTISSHIGEMYILAKDSKQPDVQERSIEDRRLLLRLACYLLEEWPHRFIALAQQHSVWSSTWLRHLESGSRERSQAAPYWFWKVVIEHLNRTRYRPSDAETLAAIDYIKRNDGILNNSRISRLVGVAYLRRKDLF